MLEARMAVCVRQMVRAVRQVVGTLVGHVVVAAWEDLCGLRRSWEARCGGGLSRSHLGSARRSSDTV